MNRGGLLRWPCTRCPPTPPRVQPRVLGTRRPRRRVKAVSRGRGSSTIIRADFFRSSLFFFYFCCRDVGAPAEAPRLVQGKGEGGVGVVGVSGVRLGEPEEDSDTMPPLRVFTRGC